MCFIHTCFQHMYHHYCYEVAQYDSEVHKEDRSEPSSFLRVYMLHLSQIRSITVFQCFWVLLCWLSKAFPKGPSTICLTTTINQSSSQSSQTFNQEIPLKREKGDTQEDKSDWTSHEVRRRNCHPYKRSLGSYAYVSSNTAEVPTLTMTQQPDAN